MDIASELTALQQDITSARSAIVAKGGTVTDGGGSSQLATDIETIQTGGGTTLNKYTYAFTTSNFNYTRLENIVKDAKGRIYLDLFGAYNYCYTGRTDSTICFEEIKFGLGYSIAVQFLFTNANVIKAFSSTTEIEGTTPSIIMSEITDDLSSVTITITYFNDTEITV